MHARSCVRTQAATHACSYGLQVSLFCALLGWALFCVQADPSLDAIDQDTTNLLEDDIKVHLSAYPAPPYVSIQRHSNAPTGRYLGSRRAGEDDEPAACSTERWIEPPPPPQQMGVHEVCKKGGPERG